MIPKDHVTLWGVPNEINLCVLCLVLNSSILLFNIFQIICLLVAEGMITFYDAATWRYHIAGTLIRYPERSHYSGLASGQPVLHWTTNYISRQGNYNNQFKIFDLNDLSGNRIKDLYTYTIYQPKGSYCCSFDFSGYLGTLDLCLRTDDGNICVSVFHSLSFRDITSIIRPICSISLAPGNRVLPVVMAYTIQATPHISMALV